MHIELYNTLKSDDSSCCLHYSRQQNRSRTDCRELQEITRLVRVLRSFAAPPSTGSGIVLIVRYSE
jgi:hypothetical protein